MKKIGWMVPPWIVTALAAGAWDCSSAPQTTTGWNTGSGAPAASNTPSGVNSATSSGAVSHTGSSGGSSGSSTPAPTGTTSSGSGSGGVTHADAGSGSGSGSSSGVKPTSSSSGSSGSSSGSKPSSSSSSGVVYMGNGMPNIPMPKGMCPNLTGLSGVDTTIAGQTAYIWSGPAKSGKTPGGPVVFYWHGTGSSPIEAASFFGSETQEVVGAGGLVASFESTTGTGTCTSGTCIFYSDDYNTADEILACAVQQLDIDVMRITSTGCSAGGLQTGSMLYARSSYLNCAMPNSGGVVFPGTLQDSHVPSLITTHGAAGSDVVGVDFSMTSLSEDMDVKSKAASSMPPGGYVVDCNHGGGHCGAPPDDVAAQWKFCKDHPFGISPDPYMGMMPSGSPAYCVYQ